MLLKIEIRGKSAIIEGYVNAVERSSRVLPHSMAPGATGEFVEVVREKTFQRAIEKADDIEVRFNHNRVLGSVKQGNLELYEDNIGLYARATVTDDQVIQVARNGELRGWSFGFRAVGESWEAENGMQKRILEDIELREVSILDQTPAYLATSIELRGEDCIVIEERGKEEEIEVTEIEEETPKELEEVDYTIQEQEIELLKLRR